MNEMNNNPNPNMTIDPNRRLKKVKRPVRRTGQPSGNAPMSARQPNQGMPANVSSETSQGNPTHSQDIDAFNLDAYIDENANLPTVADENYSIDNNQYYSQTPTPHFIDENDLVNEQIASGNYYPGMVAKKIAVVVAIATFLVGFVGAKLMFGQQKVVRDGLQGVVVNSEVPRGRARCGVAEKTQGCVLYIMNPQRSELNASDFYDLASQLTGRQRFVIETGNMRYSNQKIKPGEIAQFNIPPLQ